MGVCGEGHFIQLDSGRAEAQPVSPKVLFSCSINDFFLLICRVFILIWQVLLFIFSSINILLYPTMLLLWIVIALSYCTPGSIPSTCHELHVLVHLPLTCGSCAHQSVLQMGKLRREEVNSLVQGHTVMTSSSITGASLWSKCTTIRFYFLNRHVSVEMRVDWREKLFYGC